VCFVFWIVHIGVWGVESRDAIKGKRVCAAMGYHGFLSGILALLPGMDWVGWLKGLLILLYSKSFPSLCTWIGASCFAKGLVLGLELEATCWGSLYYTRSMNDFEKPQLFFLNFVEHLCFCNSE